MQIESAYKAGPRCPYCAASMQMLGSIPRFARLAELPTFECRLCGLTVAEAVDDEVLDDAIPLAPR